jgi:hypothetical protein
MNQNRCALPLVALVIAAAVACLSVGSSLAAAGTPQVTGAVRGAASFTLLEVAPNGIATPVPLSASGQFSFAAHRGWTLQLLGANARYFGPIELGHRGTRGWEALSGKAVKLGTIVLRSGYAMPTHRVAATAIDAALWFHTTASGAPLGAGNLGLVPRAATKTSHTVLQRRNAAVAHLADSGTGTPSNCPGAAKGTPCPGGATGAQGATGAAGSPSQSGSGSQGAGGSPSALPGGADPDQDGIPTEFDADATGSGEPNDENTQASADGAGDGLMTQIGTPIANSVNADAENVTSADIAQFVQANLGLDMGAQDPNISGVQSVTVDCGTLAYCASATVAATADSSIPQGSTWTGVLPPNPNSPDGLWQIALRLDATPGEINPGDTFQIEYHTSSGTVVQPSELTLYFATVPAVSSIGEGVGAQAAADPQTITYPATSADYGTPLNPVMLTGDSIHLDFWRPQRAAFPGETGSYYDLGHLHYGVAIAGSPGQQTNCPASDFSDLSSTLSQAPASSNPMYDASYPLVDSAADAPPSSANELGFTVDLDSCLQAAGLPTTGEELDVGLSGADASRNGVADSGTQTIAVCLPGCTIGDVAGPGGNQGQGAAPAAAMLPPTSPLRASTVGWGALASPLPRPW